MWLSDLYGQAARCCRLVVLLAVCSLFMATEAQAQTYRYSNVVIIGNARIDDSSVLRFANLPASGSVSAARLNDGYRGLTESGQFDDIAIDHTGNTLEIRLTEFPTINQIAIEGNDRLEDEQLMTLVQSKPRHVYSPALAEEDANRIADAYRLSGRFAATVTPKIIRRSDNRVDLVFEVFEGRVIETERISFVGNQVYSSNRLRRELSSKQAGIFRTFVQTDTFVAERIEIDKAQLDEFYKSRGYLDFEILSVNSEVTTERDAFFIVFHIREGKRYRFGRITTTSDVPGIDAAEYAAQSRIRTGDVYSPKQLQDTVRRMEFLAVKQGHLFIYARPILTRDYINQTVSIELRLVRGDRRFVERIEIEGNSTTLDRVIRRQFDIAEGDPYNPREVEEAVTRLRSLGLFDRVNVAAEPGSAPDQLVVRVRVEESLTGSLSFGASYSKDDGIAGNIVLSERNVLGRGQFLSFGISTGEDDSYELTFIEPHFLDRDVQFSLDTSYVTTVTSAGNYSTTQWRIEPAIRFPISETTRLRLGIALSSYELEQRFTQSFVLDQDYKRGKGDNVSASYLLDYDSRRSAFNPNIGITFTGGQRFTYGTRDDSTAIRSTGLLGGHTTLFNEDVTVTMELEAGALIASGGPSRLRDRFHMRQGIMRGFASNGIGPRDFRLNRRKGGTYGEFNPAADYNYDPGSKAYNVPLGGNYYAVSRIESRFPLGSTSETGLSGGIFFNIGSIWGLDDTRCGNYLFKPYDPDPDNKIIVYNMDREPVNNLGEVVDRNEENFDDLVAKRPHDRRDSRYPDNDRDKADCTIDDSMNLRSAVGFSLFWKSFLGPFRFNFTKDLKSEPYDTPQSFSIELASDF